MDEPGGMGQQMLVSSEETALCQRCSNPVREKDAELGRKYAVSVVSVCCVTLFEVPKMPLEGRCFGSWFWRKLVHVCLSPGSEWACGRGISSCYGRGDQTGQRLIWDSHTAFPSSCVPPSNMSRASQNSDTHWASRASDITVVRGVDLHNSWMTSGHEHEKHYCGVLTV